MDINHGEYKSGHKATYDVPKRALGLRYTLELDFYDRFLYQAICSYLIPFFDPLLSNRVFSHRFNKYGRKKHLFKHRIELWNTFENISQLALEDNKTLLVTDLLNYFEQISIDTVENAFIGMIADIDTALSASALQHRSNWMLPHALNSVQDRPPVARSNAQANPSM